MDEPFYGALNISVRVENGDVFINNELVSQLCWTPEAVGAAIGYYIAKKYYK